MKATLARLAGCSLAALLLWAAMSVAAFASQADYWRGGSDNGTRANVTGSATNNSAGLVFASVGVQNGAPNGSPTAMLQVGDLKASSGYANDCGAGAIGLASERQISGSYYCDMTFASFGTDYRLAVVHVSSGWQSYQNGTAIDGPFSGLGFSSGYSVARGEAYWSGTAPSYSFTWGPSGETAWQYTTNGGTSYSTISSASSGQDGGWSFTSLPSPFAIYR
jgi:hypothetical protein